jgi:hypothetical protein
MFSAAVGWAQSEADGVILHTTQGAENWTVATPALPAGQRIVAVACVDAESARLIAATRTSANEDAAPVEMTFTSWATDDGGSSWVEGGSFSVEQAPGLSWEGDLDYVDAQQGWFSANQDNVSTSLGMRLFGTDDGGTRWSEVAWIPPAPASPEACFGQPTATFLTPTTGWLTGGCGPAAFEVTQDGGAGWTSQSLPGDAAGELDPQPPVFTSSQDGYMLAPNDGGGGMYIYFTGDGGQSWTLRAAPQEWPHAADFIDADAGWLLSTDTMDAGYPAGLYFTEDGGQSWTTLQGLPFGVPPEGSTSPLDGSVLDFVTPSLGWTTTFGGDASQLLQTQDGGQTWSPVTVTVSGALPSD